LATLLSVTHAHFRATHAHFRATHARFAGEKEEVFMAGQTWTITIVPGAFQVDAFNQSGNTLQAAQGDIVSWNNQTDQLHQPVASDGTALSDGVPPWDTSSPGYVLPTSGVTISYACKYHSGETGTIIVK
jgi:plastocyanin